MRPLTPSELVTQWLPRLRRIAWHTGCEMDDMQQEAWLLAAAGVRDQEADDFVPRWLKAVERHARAQAKQRIIEPPPKLRHQVEIAVWLAEHQGDDPAAVLEGQQEVAERLKGKGLEVKQVIDEPRTAREIAARLGKSERQARRIKRRLEATAGLQGNLFLAGLV